MCDVLYGRDDDDDDDDDSNGSGSPFYFMLPNTATFR